MDQRTIEAAQACLVAAVKVRPGKPNRLDLVNVLMFAGLERSEAEAVVSDAIACHIIMRTIDQGYSAGYAVRK
ncbi:MAG: hypothetical protein WA021_04920 [Minisyncoccia bacterium]